jgi:hypothetical protein
MTPFLGGRPPNQRRYLDDPARKKVQRATGSLITVRQAVDPKRSLIQVFAGNSGLSVKIDRLALSIVLHRSEADRPLRSHRRQAARWVTRMADDHSEGGGWRRQERYNQLMSLDHAGWAWEAARRHAEARQLLRSYRRGRLLRRTPPVRVLAPGKGEEPAAWGWLHPARQVQTVRTRPFSGGLNGIRQCSPSARNPAAPAIPTRSTFCVCPAP